MGFGIVVDLLVLMTDAENQEKKHDCTSKHYFLTQNNHFPDPNPYTRAPPPPTTTTSTTTTTTTTTTTSVPTTASTTTTSTRTTTTSTTATTTTTASPSPSTTSMKTSTLGPRPVPVTCVMCSGLECLIKTEAEMSHQCDGGMCVVHMKEDTHLGRTIARSCGTWKTCRGKKEDNSALCTDVETQKLDWDSECFLLLQREQLQPAAPDHAHLWPVEAALLSSGWVMEPRR